MMIAKKIAPQRSSLKLTGLEERSPIDRVRNQTPKFLEKFDKKTRLTAAFFFVAISLILQLIGAKIVGSMAIKIDTWHTASHLASYAIAWGAISIASYHANSDKYVFGTGKIEVLAGFTSAVGLAILAAKMTIQCLDRLFSPSSIRFEEAIAVATIGLIINVISALILHDPDPEDHNFRAVFAHALSDVLTSVLAIIGLLVQKIYGVAGIDPAIALIGCIFIAKWSWDLIVSTGDILLDRRIKEQKEIIAFIEEEAGTKVLAAQIWKISPKKIAANITLTVDRALSPNYYKRLLKLHFPQISYLVVEIKPFRKTRRRRCNSIEP